MGKRGHYSLQSFEQYRGLGLVQVEIVEKQMDFFADMAQDDFITVYDLWLFSLEEKERLDDISYEEQKDFFGFEGNR